MNYAMLFPGQGSHYIGMYSDLYHNSTVFKETVDEAADISGVNLKKICFTGPISEFNNPITAHIAIVSLGVAAFRWSQENNNKIPIILLGHSLGEYSALSCAGVISFKDTLDLVKYRAETSKEIKKLTGSHMSIIDNVSYGIIKNVLSEFNTSNEVLFLSCINSNEQFAISGADQIMAELESRCRKQNAMVTPLLSSPPFHTQMMNPLLDEFKKKLHKIQFNYPKIPVLSNFSGRSYIGSENVIENLTGQINSTVLWNQQLEYLQKVNINYVIDMSARNIFKTIMEQKKFHYSCIGSKKDRELLKYNLEEDLLNTSGDKINKLLAITENRTGYPAEKVKEVVTKIKEGIPLDSMETSSKEDENNLIMYLLSQRGLTEQEIAWWTTN